MRKAVLTRYWVQINFEVSRAVDWNFYSPAGQAQIDGVYLLLIDVSMVVGVAAVIHAPCSTNFQGPQMVSACFSLCGLAQSSPYNVFVLEIIFDFSWD